MQRRMLITAALGKLVAISACTIKRTGTIEFGTAASRYVKFPYIVEKQDTYTADKQLIWIAYLRKPLTSPENKSPQLLIFERPLWMYWFGISTPNWVWFGV